MSKWPPRRSSIWSAWSPVARITVSSSPYTERIASYLSFTSALRGSKNTARPPVEVAAIAATSPIMVLPDDVGATTTRLRPANRPWSLTAASCNSLSPSGMAAAHRCKASGGSP